MNVEDSPEKAFEAIPEAYFDIISRVMPGVATLAMLAAAVAPLRAWSLIQACLHLELGGATLVLLTAVVGSYVLSMLLIPVATLVERINFAAFHRRKGPGKDVADAALDQAEQFGLRPHKKFDDLRYVSRAFFRRRDAAAAVQLSKILAEILFLNTLSAGALLAGAITLALALSRSGIVSLPAALVRCAVLAAVVASALAAARSHLAGYYGKVIDYFSVMRAKGGRH